MYTRTNNAEEVIRGWPIHWGNIPAPSNHMVIKTFRNFLEEGTCVNVNEG